MADKKDKDEMSTAVTTTPADDARGGKGSMEPLPSAPIYQAYKPGEGYATRLGMMVVCMAYVGFACHHWYYNWVFLRDFADRVLSAVWLGFLVNWTREPGVGAWIAGLGTAGLAIGGFALAYYFIYVKRNSSEFLIKTDVELAKVTWPQVVPWFKPETKVWGATYVVLIVVAAMTAYVFVIDVILKTISGWMFYGK